MNNTSCTEGTWTPKQVDIDDGQSCIMIVCAETKTPICMLCNPNDKDDLSELMSNALLITHAKDLYSALISAKAIIDEYVLDVNVTGYKTIQDILHMSNYKMVSESIAAEEFENSTKSINNTET